MKRFSTTFALITMGFLSGCGSTMVTQSWKNPDFKGPIQFKKVAIMAVSNEEGTRRIAEDELVSLIGPDKAITTYTAIPMEKLKDEAFVKGQINGSGADGLVVIRPVDKRQETNYVPGAISAPYYSPWGYSSMAWGRVYEPGYLTTDTIVQLETNIYSVADEKLIWSGASETFNPADLRKEVKNYAKVIKARLKKEKLIP